MLLNKNIFLLMTLFMGTVLASNKSKVRVTADKNDRKGKVAERVYSIYGNPSFKANLKELCPREVRRFFSSNEKYNYKLHNVEHRWITTQIALCSITLVRIDLANGDEIKMNRNIVFIPNGGMSELLVDGKSLELVNMN